MLGTLAILFAGAGIAALELPALLRRHKFKDAAIFLSLLALGLILAIWTALPQELPNPLDWIIWMFEPWGEQLHRILS
ncbi:hypothetical protein IDH44_10500 [Paenibacillus sp. IB182496]|uniref:Uncharacterized protein n=1 Tax=Paenibacillus sabuli TaxID=2772509 RepID=A0A927BU95_9BACL|nr:hypothetical protein [Paenibacillus sabuli]MBD2845619.1 hypothetical protein [Paenibacillus sabuli]